MIYTVTLNPALDRTMWVERIRYDQSNRIVREDRFAGGKGIDVSRGLTNLGVPNVALGFLGGFTGEEMRARLQNENVTCDFVRIHDETRTNIIIHELSSGRQLSFNAEGPEVKPHEIKQLVEKLDALAEAELVVISGSLPPGLHHDIHRKLIESVRQHGAKVLLDLTGPSLRVGINSRADYIRTDASELAVQTGGELITTADVLAAARHLQKETGGTVLVSTAARETMLVDDEHELIATPPVVKVESTTGAADAAIAAFLYGLQRCEPVETCLRYAVAAETAKTMTP
ncbi:MAG: 1-phosphofructokinase family hexose kinase, partial [Syntrophomonadaceae bacterium]|nr:1-phosphofructokinase family hexose kinase [Syntrophomonadaceae bacterium]